MFRDVIKEECNHCFTGGSSGIRRNGLEGNAGGCNGAAYRAVETDLETLEKEHKGVIHEIGKLRKRESELIKERDEAKESARKVLESLLEFENKQYVKPSAAATRVKPEKFSGSSNDTDFQAFLDQFEACARMNGRKEEEKANQLILCMREKACVSTLSE